MAASVQKREREREREREKGRNKRCSVFDAHHLGEGSCTGCCWRVVVHFTAGWRRLLQLLWQNKKNEKTKMTHRERLTQAAIKDNRTRGFGVVLVCWGGAFAANTRPREVTGRSGGQQGRERQNEQSAHPSPTFAPLAYVMQKQQRSEAPPPPHTHTTAPHTCGMGCFLSFFFACAFSGSGR